MCLALAGCNENEHDSSQQLLATVNTKPNTPIVSTSNTSKALLSVSGGSLTAKENIVTFPASALTTGTFVELSVTADPVINSRFDDGVWGFDEGTTLSSEELRIKVEKTNFLPNAEIKLKIKIPSNIASQINSQTNVSLLYLDTFERDGDEAESIDSVLSIPVVYDAATQSVTATAPVSVFRTSEDGSASVVFKVVLTKKADSSKSLVMAKSVVSVKAVNSECKTPIPTESAGAASSYVNPLKQQLKIVGPYSEQDVAHAASKHGGIDFAVNTGNPVYSVRSGYIAKIKEAACNNCSNPLFYMVVSHPDGSATRYLHLKRFSVIDAKGSLIQDGTKTVKDKDGKELTVPKTVDETQKSWKENNSSCPKFPIVAGDKIALSGNTGTENPHLHFEAANKVDLSDGFGISTRTRFNPIMNFGMVSFDKPDIGLTPDKPSQEIHINFKDYTQGSEILVRRKKPNTYLPITAQGSNFELRSHWPVLKIDWAYNDEILSNGSKDFLKAPPQQLLKQRQDILKTDEGIIEFGVKEGDFPDVEREVIPKVTVSAVEDAIAGSQPTVTKVGMSKSQTVTVKIGKDLSPFTKISATGEKLPKSAIKWSCVLHNESGLMSEEKTDDGGLRDKDNRYTWFEDSSGYEELRDYYSGFEPYGFYCANTLAKCNTKAYVNAVNKLKLCGYSNWRLGTREELEEKVGNLFYTSGLSVSWSSTHDIFQDGSGGSYAATYAAAVDINNRNNSGNFYKYSALPVRLVRSSQ